MITYNNLGAKEISSGNETIVSFGILLPDLTDENFTLEANCILESDFFDNEKIIKVPMSFDSNNSFGFWQGLKKSAELSKDSNPQKFLYWYTLRGKKNKTIINDYIIDPYSREFGFGKFSSFTLNYQKHLWSDDNWTTHELKNLIIYELHIIEFGKDIEGCINKLDYLNDLGVNCIEIMPVHNIKDTANWGYLPIAHFGVDERFGIRKDLQALIDKAHQKEIAVIIDVIFGHTSLDFTYNSLYANINKESPFNKKEEKWGGKLVDFQKPLPFEYYEAVMHNFFDNYHVDGFRFDCVSEYFDNNENDYKEIVSRAQKLVDTKKWKRFENRLPILCAEYLTDKHEPQYILDKTESNCCMQNKTFDVSTNLAKALKANNNHQNISNNIKYLEESNFNNSWYPKDKYPFINICNHDHTRFVTNFFDINDSNKQNFIFDDYCLTFEQRGKYWFKVQPFLIGMILARGIPFIWQGQELCENYYVDEDISSISRVKIFRDIRWEYIFDQPGSTIHSLVKRLINIRKNYPDFFIDGDYNYHGNEDLRSKKILIFSRKNKTNVNAYVILNFSDNDYEDINLQLNLTDYQDLVKNDSLSSVNPFSLCSNYGRVLMKKTN